MRLRDTIIISVSAMAMLIGSAHAATPRSIAQKVRFQTAVWRNIPLNIVLPIGKQRIIQVPHSAQIGLPSNIANSVISQRLDGWFYLTATKAFKPHTVEIKDNVTGQTILINLSAAKNASDYGVHILYAGKKEKKAAADNDGQGPSINQSPQALQGSMAYKTLTQYAEQQLYAPKRLLKNPFGISLSQSYTNSMGQVPKNKWVYNLFLDGSVVAQPWATWFGGSYYVTAVLIKNLLHTDINLRNNLVNLCGRQGGVWKAVTFFPYQTGHQWQLSSAGIRYDTTVAFLISSQPFDQAIKHCQREA